MTDTKWHERPLVRLLFLVAAIAADLLIYHLSTAGDGGVLIAANQLITPTWVMKEIGRRLVNNLKFAANVQRS